MIVLVTGAAGFIGSNFCDYALKQGATVVGVDNFSTGQPEFLESARRQSRFSFHEQDLIDFEKTKSLFAAAKPDLVVHLAANADVRFGLDHPRKDLEQGTLVSFNVLESARLAGTQRFAFSSTGSVYGEPSVFPTPETCPFPTQTSLYAASKLAVEGLIQAYAEGYGMRSTIFRFVSILGPRYTHGHVLDFVQALKHDPTKIKVLGDGMQTKAYLHIDDCVRAFWQVVSTQTEKLAIYNLGPDEHITVNQSLDEICRVLGVSPKREYSGGKRGWVGDSPFIFLDCKKLQATGWKASRSIRESVADTVNYLLQNPWVFERRGHA